MVIAPKAGNPFGEQDPAYFLLWHDFLGIKCERKA